MPQRTRDLTLDDILSIMALSGSATDRMQLYKAVEMVAAETVGFVFLTTLKQNDAEACVERVHSSHEQAYPIGGRKPLSKITQSSNALDVGDIFLAGTKQDVIEAFFDHELIISLGATAIMNAPIRHSGKRLGTLNFSGVENQYGEPKIRNAKLLAGLLVPSLISKIDG